MIEVQATGLTELEVILSRAASKALSESAAVVGKGSLNIKRDWQARWKGLGHAPALPYAIGYDVFYTIGAIRSEIGPDKGRRQGALGNLLEFGSVNNAPTPGGAPALAAEAPKTERAFEELGERLLK
jgi:hypothetical protein